MQFLSGHEISFDTGATDGLTRIWVDLPDTKCILIKSTLEELVSLREELTKAISAERRKRK